MLEACLILGVIVFVLVVVDDLLAPAYPMTLVEASLGVTLMVVLLLWPIILPALIHAWSKCMTFKEYTVWVRWGRKKWVGPADHDDCYVYEGWTAYKRVPTWTHLIVVRKDGSEVTWFRVKPLTTELLEAKRASLKKAIEQGQVTRAEILEGLTGATFRPIKVQSLDEAREAVERDIRWNYLCSPKKDVLRKLELVKMRKDAGLLVPNTILDWDYEEEKQDEVL